MAKREREKAEKRERERDKRPYAVARYIRIPSSKIDIVLDLIRGKDFSVAAAILKNTNKSACAPVLKVLNSAGANAENNLNIMKDNLYVAECMAMAGPSLKRMMPRARGRADRILKRTSHIRIVLDERADTSEKPVKTKANSAKTSKEKTAKVTKAVKSETQKGDTMANEIPDTQSERPLTNEPNHKKPLGTKKLTAKTAAKPKAGAAVKKGAKK